MFRLALSTTIALPLVAQPLSSGEGGIGLSAARTKTVAGIFRSWLPRLSQSVFATLEPSRQVSPSPQYLASRGSS